MGLEINLAVGLLGHPDPARMFSTANLAQTEFATIEIRKAGLLMGYPDELTFVAPGPGVVRTAEPLAATFTVTNQLRTAMAAYVEERAYDAVLTAHDEQRSAAELHRFVRTRLGKLAAVEHNPRLAAEDRKLPGEMCGIEVPVDTGFNPLLVQKLLLISLQLHQLVQKLNLQLAVHPLIPPALEKHIS